MVEEELNFFEIVHDILMRRDLSLLELLISQTKSALRICDHKLKMSYLITHYNLFISYILKNDICIDFYHIDKDILKSELEILKFLKEHYNHLKIINQNDEYFNYVYTYYELLKIFTSIDIERTSFGEDNYNEGRTILNKLRIGTIEDQINKSKELTKSLQRSLTSGNI